jgi:dTDP-4-amino-4,6-dideoxygalactose transaminase
MLNTPFSPWPSFTEEEADAVKRVLLSNRVNYWTGQETREFEHEFADWCGTQYAVALHNGTAALELPLRAMGIGPGAEVIVTPRTFIASASAIVMCGAKPVFADIDPDSQNITAATITPLITDRTKAIICVHLAGWPCDMDPIMELARRHNLKVIEDCAQAHGATYKGRSVGSIGDIGAWSFCQDKIMTTGGEGGMVTTNDKTLWQKIWSLKDHGKSWEAVYERQHAPGFRWLHESFGTNMRMLEMQAVIGRIQLQRMPDWHRQRTANAIKLQAVCEQLEVIREPEIPAEIEHAWYRFYAFVRPEKLANGWSRDRIVETIVAAGVPCYQGSCSEIYREQAFVDADLTPTQPLPIAQELGDTAFCLLVHPTLTQAEMDQACDTLHATLLQAARL